MADGAASRRCVIIGGGISGLATAHRLSAMLRRASLPIEITVLEAQARFGGVIQTQQRDGFLMEAGPDAFLTEKPWALELCRELGLESELIPTNDADRRSFIAWRGRLHEVPEGWYLLAPDRLGTVMRMGLLSWPGRLRMACEPWIPARRDSADETVGEFVRRRFGREALERIGQPMVGGIYTADPDQLSLRATLPRFHEMEQESGSVIRALARRSLAGGVPDAKLASGPRYSLFVSLRHGVGQLVDGLLARLQDVRLRPGARVAQLGGGAPWRVVLQDGSVVEADALCVALPAPQAAALLRGMAPGLATELAAIPYESLATINLAFRRADLPRPLRGFGFVVPAIERRPLVGCSFSSLKFPGRAPDGSVLVRVFVGGALQRELLQHPDDALVEMVREQLRELAGVRGEPVLASVHRFPAAMPQYLVGHRDRVARIARLTEAVPGLFLTGNGYDGVGIPDCIHQAGAAAEKIASWLTRHPSTLAPTAEPA